MENETLLNLQSPISLFYRLHVLRDYPKKQTEFYVNTQNILSAVFTLKGRLGDLLERAVARQSVVLYPKLYFRFLLSFTNRLWHYVGRMGAVWSFC